MLERMQGQLEISQFDSPGVSAGPEMEVCRLVLLKDILTAVADEGRRDKECRKLGLDCNKAGLGSVP